MKSVTLAALLYSSATPVEIWAAIQLSKSDYTLGSILMAIGMGITFFGIKKWISAQTCEVEEDLEEHGLEKKTK